MNNSKRYIYIDKIKGLAILLIVLGHIILWNGNEGNYISNYIYTFHVPIFFIISGFLYYSKRDMIFQKSNKEIFIEKSKKILYPYFTFSVICVVYLVIRAILNYQSISSIVKVIINIIFFFGYGPLWFLPTLFIAEIIFYIILKFKSPKILIIFLIICSIFCILLSPILQGNFWQENLILEFMNKCINLITRSLLGCLFIFVGFGFGKIKHFLEKINIGYYIIILIFNIYICKFNGQIDMHYCKLNNIFLFFYLAIVNSITIIMLFNKLDNNKNNLLSFFGKNSMIIMLTHFNLPIIDIAMYISTNLIKLNTLNNFIVFLIVMLIEYYLILIINKYMTFLLNINKIKIRQ